MIFMMSALKRFLTFSLSFFLLAPALAAQGKANHQATQSALAKKQVEKPVSRWNGTNAQVGLIIDTGNTKSTNLNAGAEIKYGDKPWLNVTNLNLALNRNAGVTTKKQFFIANQIQYSLSGSHKNFVYGNVDYTRDYFGPYLYQFDESVGYGRDLFSTDKFSWSAQAGPGLRFNYEKNPKRKNTDFIIYTSTTADWKVFKDSDLSEKLEYTFGRPYNYLKSVTALTNKLAGHLAMQASYQVEYYSKIPHTSSNTKKIDTVTNIALVYNF